MLQAQLKKGTTSACAIRKMCSRIQVKSSEHSQFLNIKH